MIFKRTAPRFADERRIIKKKNKLKKHWRNTRTSVFVDRF